jgi:hypothetical protein
VRWSPYMIPNCRHIFWVSVMKKLSKLFAIIAALAAISATRAAATTYAVSLYSAGNMAIGGSITTNGNGGHLGAADVLDWDLIGVVQDSNGTRFSDWTGPLSGNNSSILSAHFYATPLTLYDGSIQFLGPAGTLYLSASCNPSSCQAYIDVTVDNPSTGIFLSSPDGVFADGKTIPAAPTPLPASLPLSTSGLGVLGLLGWRRKRKGQATA